MLKLSEIAAPLQGLLQGDTAFLSISTDSRNIQKGDLFIALKGEKFNGNQFVATAQASGAIGAIISEPVATSLPTLKVSDTRIALGQLATYYRQKFTIPLVGLTGSCGKTTTKTMLASILNQAAPTLATEGTLNNDIGVPLTLMRLRPEHRYAVIEMGANHLGEISYLTHIARPNIAIITNIAPAHLEGFGSLEGVVRAKSEIFESLPSDGIAIINRDDTFFPYWQKILTHIKTITFGHSKEADVSAQNIQIDDEGFANFDIIAGSQTLPVKLSITGEHNILNALAATAAAQALNIAPHHIQAGLKAAQPVYRRLVIHKTNQGATIIDDSYNANPLSVRAAIQLLAQKSGIKILALGDMRELGENAAQYHEEIGRAAKQSGIDRLYAYGTLSAFTVQAFGDQGYHFLDQHSLITAVQKELAPHVNILVKGSLSTEMNKVVAALLNAAH